MSNIVTIKDIAKLSSQVQAVTQSTCQGAFTYEFTKQEMQVNKKDRVREKDVASKCNSWIVVNNRTNVISKHSNFMRTYKRSSWSTIAYQYSARVIFLVSDVKSESTKNIAWPCRLHWQMDRKSLEVNKQRPLNAQLLIYIRFIKKQFNVKQFFAHK